MPLRLHKLNLSHFRNYDTLRIEPRGARIVVLTGDNGAGKTNLLEAVSLLAPGKGLRGAELSDIQARDGGGNLWAVAAEVETPQGLMMRLGTGLDREMKRRVIRLDGRDMKSQNELSGIISAVWLTPQMDRLFLEGAGPRRRFLDRLVYSYAPDHAARVSRAEKHLRDRMRLLQEGRAADPQWLDTLESQIAGDSVAIAAARVQFLESLQHHAFGLKEKESLFPVPLLQAEGTVEARVDSMPALALEDDIRLSLRNGRAADGASGRTEGSILRSDLKVVYADKNMPAAQCSTGEQKGLLVAIILAHAFMMQAEKGHVPLILLDEVAAHLDDARRAQLLSFLSGVEGQVWLTGTDARMFSGVESQARFYTVSHGHARESATLEAAS